MGANLQGFGGIYAQQAPRKLRKPRKYAPSESRGIPKPLKPKPPETSETLKVPESQESQQAAEALETPKPRNLEPPETPETTKDPESPKPPILRKPELPTNLYGF